MKKIALLGYLSVFISAVLYWVGFSMVRPVMSLFFADEGYRAAAIGLFTALNSALPIVLAMPLGNWIDRIGTKRAVLLGSLISLTSGAAFLIGNRTDMIGIVLFGQVINGIGGLLSWGALQAAASLSAKNHPDANRSVQILSNFTFVNSLAQLAGPSVGGVLSDIGGYSLTFAVFLGINAAAAALAMLLPGPEKKPAMTADSAITESPDLAQTPRYGWIRTIAESYRGGYNLLRRNQPFFTAIVLNGIMYMLVDLRTTFFPLYLDNLGLSHSVIGAVLSVSALSTLLVRPFTAYAIKRLGQYKIMISSMAAGGLCLVLLAFNPGIALLSAVMFIWGASTGINQPMAMIMVSQSVHPGEQGMGMTMRTMSNRVVQMANPLFFGVVSTLTGLSLGFGAMGLLVLGAGIVYRRKQRKQRRLAVGHRDVRESSSKASS